MRRRRGPPSPSSPSPPPCASAPSPFPSSPPSPPPAAPPPSPPLRPAPTSASALPPAPPAAFGRTDVPFSYHKLKNGLKVVLSPDHTAPIVALAVYYNIGFRNEPRGRTGFAHLFEHMMFQGSQNLGKTEHMKLVEGNGGEVNGSTRFDFTNYMEIVPAHTLRTMLWAESDRMRGLSITEENLQNQKDVVKNEVKGNVLNRPYGGFPWLDMPQIANENYYNAHNFYGELADIDAAKLDEVKAFFKTYYAPNNAVVVASGDLDEAEALGWIKSYFEDIPQAPLPSVPDMSEPAQTKEKRVTKQDALAPRPALAIGYHAPPRNTPAWYAMALLDQVLAQGNDSRLYQSLVQKKGLTGEVSATMNQLGNMFNIAGASLWTVSLFHDADKPKEAIVAAIDEQIDRLRKEPLDPAALALARVKMRSELYDRIEQFHGFGLADLLASFALFDDDPGRINHIEDELAKVTPELVQKTAAEWLRPENRTLLFIEPKPAPPPEPPKGDATKAEATKGKPAAKTKPSAAKPAPKAAAKGAANPAAVPAPAAAPLAKVAPPPAGTPKPLSLPAIKSFALPGGTPVTLIPYGAVPKVRVEIDFDAGNVEEGPDETWLADFTSKLLTEGTAEKSATDIASAAAKMGGWVEAAAQAVTSVVRGEVLSDFGPDLVRLLAEIARKPAFPAAEVPRILADLTRDRSMALAEPSGLVEQKFAALLYPGQAYGRLYPTEEGLRAFTAEKARAFHARLYTPKRARLYVAGRFDAAAVEQAIRASLGDWTGGTPRAPLAPHAESVRAITLIDRPGAVQSVVTLGLPVATLEEADWMALRVMNTLLGGYFGSRITTNLREDKGYTYSPYSDTTDLLGTSYWAQHADITTAVTGPALKEIFAEIDRLSREAPSEAEMRAVKSYLTGGFVLDTSTRRGLIQKLTLLDGHGIARDWLAAYTGRLGAVTAGDVGRVTRQYLDPARMTVVIAGDRKEIEKQVAPFGPIR
ncbi:MAG: pitrilysin family protein [Byssovorax sp.]